MKRITVRDLYGNEHFAQGTVDVTQSLNGQEEITLNFAQTTLNEKWIQDISNYWRVIFDNKEYVVVLAGKKPRGKKVMRSIKAIHHFFVSLANNWIYETHDGSMTFENRLKFLFKGTSLSYSVIDGFYAASIDGFGNSSSLDLLSKTLDAHDAEIEVSGNRGYFRAQTGSDSDFQIRRRLNLKDISIEEDGSGFGTYAKGFGEILNEETGERLEVEYQSPLADIPGFGVIHIPPVDDEKYTIKENLLAAVKKQVDESISVSMTVDMVDLRAQGYNKAPYIGDRIFVYDEVVKVNIETRIIDINTKYNEQLKPVSVTVTLSNQSIKEAFRSQLNNTVKQLKDIAEGRGQIPYSVLPPAAKRAAEALNNSLTQLEYPPNLGIIARDPKDANRYTIFNSSGLGITRDGGNTYEQAITPDGINTALLTAGAILTNNITIFGGDSETYASIYGEIIETKGTYDRTWFGSTEKIESEITMGRGYLRLSKLNDERGRRNLYLTNNGLATFIGGASEDDGFGSGVIEFWSYMFESDRRGLTLYSNLGTVGFKTESRDIVSDSYRDVIMKAQIGRIIMRPRDSNRSGDNEFSFNVKENPDKWDQDGVIQYGSESNGYASAIRMSKDPSDPVIYITNGNGDFFTGDLHAKDITAHGRFYGDVVGSLIASADNSYAMVNGSFRVTDTRGYNNGNITYKPITASEFNTASSKFFKKNIEDVQLDATDLIRSTPVREYHMLDDIDEVDMKRIGLIVQESPLEIINMNDGESIDIYAMASLLWKSNQELNERIATLEGKREAS
ncbi:phage tail protein [Terribacillus sp. JSM ZJ617]|uniref:phage tail protein n=1 Tax=Terribacillus sp. JSM ZJ617 TaxID=3342119 RepID=UPI0035A8B12A